MNNTTENNHIERPPRIAPDDFIMVLDANSQEVVGKVVNFNETGMQLLMHNDLQLNEIIELTLVIKTPQSEKQYITVFAELLWVKKAESHDNVLGGFFLSSKDFKSKFRLNQLIKSFN